MGCPIELDAASSLAGQKTITGGREDGRKREELS
jgi:hypothetical protein